MEFGKTRWSCSWNSDKTVHKSLPWGDGGPVGGVGMRVQGVIGAQGWGGWGFGGLFDMKLTLSV